MALSASARVRKCQLKKAGKTPEEINTYLLENGYIKVKEKKNARLPEEKPESPSVNSRSGEVNNVNDSKIDPKKDHITEELWEKCILKLVQESEKMTPAIIDKIKDFLDKKERITKDVPVTIKPPESDAVELAE